MDDLSAKRTDQASCRHCGAPLAGHAYVHERDGYCCEGCFLAAHRYRALPAGADEGQCALGEALVAALDAREHETGLHSKRVACHTLVLARHFSADPRQLQQVYLGALLHDIGKIAIPDSILVFIYQRLAKREEADRLAEFGDEYQHYRDPVPAFVPKFSSNQPRKEIT